MRRSLLVVAALGTIASGCALTLDPDEYLDAPPGSGGKGLGGAGGAGATASAAGGGGDPACSSDEAPTIAWSSHISADPSAVYARDVAADSDGNIYLLTTCVSGATIVDSMLGLDCASAAEHLVVIKLDATGVPLWSTTITSATFAERAAIAVGDSDAVWVAGGYGALAGEPVAITGCPTEMSAGGRDGFLARLHKDGGSCAWLASFGGNAGDDYATDVVGIDSDSVAVVGRFTGAMTIGTTQLTTSLMPSTFVARFDSAGTSAWAIDLKGGAVDEPDVRVAWGGGKLVAAGTFDGALDGKIPPNGGGRDIFALDIGPVSGMHGAPALFGGVQEDRLLDVAIDARGPTLLASFETGQLDLGGSIGTLVSDSRELVVLGLSPDLSPRFALDEDGQIAPLGSLAAGASNGDLFFAVSSGETLEDSPSVAQGLDVYAGRIGCDGKLRWIDRFGDGDSQTAAGAAMLPDGTAVIAGDFNGAIDLDAHLDSGTGRDVFAVRFDSPR